MHKKKEFWDILLSENREVMWSAIVMHLIGFHEEYNSFMKMTLKTVTFNFL